MKYKTKKKKINLHIKAIKKLISFTLSMSLALSLGFTTIQGATIIYDNNEYAYTNTNVGIRIDNELVVYDGMYPVILNNRTLVPVREIMESPNIQANVEWIAELQSIVITKNGRTIVLKIGDQVAYVNGQELLLDSPARLIKDKDINIYKTMVPIRFISESLGYDVSWDAVNKEVLISTATSIESLMLLSESRLSKFHSTALEIPLSTSLINSPKRLMTSGNEEVIVLKDGENQGEYPNTELIDIVGNERESKFYITSQESMSKITYQIWDDKLIIDINGLIMNNFPTSIRMDKGVYVSTVRTSQYNEEPFVGRIVFDLYEKSIPREVIVSEDRKTIEVVFNEIGLSRIDIRQDLTGDYIEISGDFTDYNAFRSSELDMIIFDFPHTINLLGDQRMGSIDGQLLSSLNVFMTDKSTTRFVLNTTDIADVDFKYDKINDLTTIRLSPLVIEGLSFDYETVPTIKIPRTGFLLNYSIESMDLLTDPSNLTTVVDFNTYIPELASQEFFVGDDLTNRLSIKIEDGHTKILLDQKHILEPKVTSDENYIYITGQRPKDIYDTIVLIDAGHGGYQPGASYNGIIEKDVNLKLMNYIRAFTEARQDIKYYYTRTTDVAVSLSERVDMANDLEADLLVSMHNNALDIRGNPLLTEIRGLEVITTKGMDTTESELVFANTFIGNMKTYLPEMVIRNIKDNNKLYILKYSDMPAAIIEFGYLTNPQDADNLKQEWMLQEAARITEMSIHSFLKP